LGGTLQLEYRLNVGFPVGAWDGAMLALLAVGLWCGMFRPGRVYGATLPALLAAFAVATLGATIVALQNGNATYEFLLTLRNFIAVPLSAWAVFAIVGRDFDYRTFFRWLAVAGAGSGLLVVVFVLGQGGQSRQPFTDVNQLRTVDYGTFAALLATVLLTYAMTVKLVILGKRLDALALMIAFVGAIATLSRSDWVSLVAGLVPIVFLVPAASRRSLFRLILVGVPVLAVGLAIFGALGSALLDVDLLHIMSDRVATLDPNYAGELGQNRAYDSRLPGAENEIREWLSGNIFFGSGFGWERRDFAADGNKHNVWTSTLAESGIFGVVAYLVALALLFRAGAVIVSRFSRGPAQARDPFIRAYGAFAIASAVFFFVHGMVTLSFNTLREAVTLGIVLGVALKLEAVVASEPTRVPAGAVGVV
jgi:hypothetical protein